jgi:hypothetical protein
MDHGVATWSTPAWQARAVAWVDEQLAASGRARTGAPEQPRVRPWATVLRVPTTGGPVWMKAAGPGTAFEAALYPLLARVVPDRVLAPLGIDIERGWMLLPDGGPSLGERREGDELVDALSHALADYGRLQLELAPHVDELLALGVTDMRPAAMPAAFERALLAVRRDGGDEALLTRVAALRPDVAAWCAQLATSPLSTTTTCTPTTSSATLPAPSATTTGATASSPIRSRRCSSRWRSSGSSPATGAAQTTRASYACATPTSTSSPPSARAPSSPRRSPSPAASPRSRGC